jgi:hypothetical protein
MKPNDKEISCIQFASKFYPQPKKPSFFERLLGKKEDIFDASKCDVSDNKTFSRLWADYGLRDCGMDYTYRKLYYSDEKTQCLKEWVKILYNKSIDLDALELPLKEKNLKIREEFRKENPGGHISTRKTEDMLPEIIDKLFGSYK